MSDGIQLSEHECYTVMKDLMPQIFGFFEMLIGLVESTDARIMITRELGDVLVQALPNSPIKTSPELLSATSKLISGAMAYVEMQQER